MPIPAFYLEKQQVSIELVKESAIPRFALDTTQFRQLFLNLIRNAAEAMPSGGTIKISLCFDGDFLTIRVQDTGCGIPAEDLPTLFDLFVTHKKNGTGLWTCHLQGNCNRTRRHDFRFFRSRGKEAPLRSFSPFPDPCHSRIENRHQDCTCQKTADVCEVVHI